MSSKGWKPKDGEPYWFIRFNYNLGGKTSRSILEVVHTSYFYTLHNNRPLYNAKFRTRKEAEQILRQIKQLLKGK